MSKTYPTGLVDSTRPMELDDGREAVLAIPSNGNNIHVNITGSPYRDKRHDAAYRGTENYFYYYADTGVFGGGSAESYYVLRNRDDSASFIPEDWS